MDKKLIAKKLIELRADQSREEVSNANKISISALQMYENGQRIPKDEIKVRLANYYHVTVQALFFGDKPHVKCSSHNKEQEVSSPVNLTYHSAMKIKDEKNTLSKVE